MKQYLPSVRAMHWFGLTLIVLMLATVTYLQFVLGIMPCLLCVLQRYVLAILGLAFLLGALLPVATKKTHLGLLMISFLGSLSGIALAGRQVYLEHLPPGTSLPCLPSLDYLLANFPLTQVFKLAMNGSSDCAEVTWRFMGQSLATLTLVTFCGFLLLNLLQWYQMKEHR